MSLLRTTPGELATYATSLAGMSRDRLPVPWTDSAAIDDCARFCSSALWGGTPGPISWVDNFKTAGDGSYAPGSGDLEPWDVILFDWEGNGVGNHVEFMVSADANPAFVRTFGANGSDTKAAAYRRRPRSYILGRFRPRWATAGAPTTDPHTALLEDIMSNGSNYSRHINPANAGDSFVVGPLGTLAIGDGTARKMIGGNSNGNELLEVLAESGVGSTTARNAIVYDRMKQFWRSWARKARAAVID